MTSSISTITFPVAQPDVQVSKPLKQILKTITEGGKTKQVLEAWVDFGGATPQVSTLTITAGSNGNDYIIEISNGTKTALVSYVQQAGDTASKIAERLTDEINGVPTVSELVSATVNNNVITLTSDEPGVTLNYDVSASTTPGNLVVAQTTPASGTAKMRKVGEIKINFEVPVGGRNISAVSQAVFYDGSEPAVIARSGTENRANHPQSLEALAKTVNS